MSTTAGPLRKQILQVFEQILGHFTRGDLTQLVLGEPPLSSTNGWYFKRLSGQPLPDRKGTGYLQAKAWPRQALNASGFPTLLLVAEGEAHFRIGITRKMARRRPQLARSNGCYIVELKAPACLLLPPDVPYSDASRPHWESADRYQLDSRLLWINLLPEAAICHLCTTQQGEHLPTNALMVADQQLYILSGLMLDELREQKQHFAQTALSLLQTILLRAGRGVASQEAVPANEEVVSQVQSERQQYGGATHSAELDRACRFINGNLGKPLNPELIANQAFVSVTRLKRLFAQQLDTSIMRYVKQQRMTSACFYLRSSRMLIQEIASNLGYAHLSQFSRDFTLFTGTSPRAYRDPEE